MASENARLQTLTEMQAAKLKESEAEDVETRNALSFLRRELEKMTEVATSKDQALKAAEAKVDELSRTEQDSAAKERTIQELQARLSNLEATVHKEEREEKEE